jgi:hypothetical protein|tara:strand:+ start:1160 stop:1666 length:507 start_codon:yes stop_codon:yes gene_type:complete
MTELNKNMLSPVGFNFQIKKTPDMNFFIQSVTLPGVTLGSFEIPNPLKSVPMYGDHITYGELEVVFKINEDMTNYLEIFNWITALGFPDDFKQFKSIKSKTISSGDGIFSDATLSILSSAMNPTTQIFIQDLFPISLSPVTVDTRDTSIDHVEATASFRFQNYTFTSL